MNFAKKGTGIELLENLIRLSKMQMEIFKKTNQLTEDLISFLIAPFYSKGDNKEATGNSIRYFVDFNDPTTPERELRTTIFTINLKALMEIKRSGRVDATPSNLDEYMRQRAKNSPQDMALLNLVAFFKLVLLFRKAERRNNADLYCACMRLSLPLLAVTNASNYDHIFCDMILYWETCSDCEQLLIKAYGFTMKTTLDLTMWAREVFNIGPWRYR